MTQVCNNTFYYMESCLFLNNYNLETFLSPIEGRFPPAVDSVQVTFHLSPHLVQQVLVKVGVDSVIYKYYIYHLMIVTLVTFRSCCYSWVWLTTWFKLYNMWDNFRLQAIWLPLFSDIHRDGERLSQSIAKLMKCSL